MQEQDFRIFEAQGVLQRVWRHDYPPTWQVFLGPIVTASTCLLRLAQFLLGAIAVLMVLLTIVGVVGITLDKGFDIGYIVVLGIVLVVAAGLVGLIMLLQRGVRAAEQQARGKPRRTMVVTPENVVAYERGKTRAIYFAHIAQMRLRVKANTTTTTTFSTSVGPDGSVTSTPMTTTTPAAPSIWLDLTYRNGEQGIWKISLLPQDTIAQTILDAFTRYRLDHGY
ncbi:hypothetical protein [Ktedonospora formicarum]|uniref:Uncharacterized protein n=1 Tax=Ktedonospora formicarum TaxID=2778364 RepID=A0A8J3MX26_9CHLR|nr:hypothetical protein [Ktedonospora formicarum]GHO49556.1 hypothetical protein KSX_77190 [Ktedonospora formicarum]